MDSSASCQHLPCDCCFGLYCYSLCVHCQYRRQPSPSIPDDSPTFANSMDAFSIPARTTLHEDSAPSTSFDLKEVCHSLHFTFVVHCHLLELKKDSINFERKIWLTYILDILLGAADYCWIMTGCNLLSRHYLDDCFGSTCQTDLA